MISHIIETLDDLCLLSLMGGGMADGLINNSGAAEQAIFL
jgi:hypothetical protein